MDIQDKNRIERTEKENKKKDIYLRKASVRPGAVGNNDNKDYKLIALSKQIDRLSKIIVEQSKMINELRNDFKASIGLPVVKMKTINYTARSSHDFSSEYSNPNSNRKASHNRQDSLNHLGSLKHLNSNVSKFSNVSTY